MELIRAIQLRALRSVLKPDKDYLVRKMLRWYSKTYFTPLREVEELPFDEVMQAYFEERYEGMSDDDRDAERQALLTTEEQRYQQILAEEAEEAEMFELGRIVAAEEERKKLEADKAKEQKIAEVKHQKPGPIIPRELPESDLSTGLPKVIPEGITMSFVDDAEFERELEGFGAMGQPRKP
jgi:hypothetical protein